MAESRYTYGHEFETLQGDELSPEDMRNATWKVVETFVNVRDLDDYEICDVVFTHRIEVHWLDELMFPITQTF